MHVRGLILVIGMAWFAFPAYAIDAIVVRPSQWSPALQPWKAYRSAQGYEILEVDAQPDARALRRAILEHAQDPHLKYVLLAGDADRTSAFYVPTFYRPSSALVQFGGDAMIATDNPFADLDGDTIPELAVARIPADSSEQLEQALARVMAYETRADFSQWQRKVHVVAGVGGFGAVADSVIEMTTRRFLADRIPGWSQLSMTHASVDSHYCPDPWQFSEACVARLNEGGMFWVYIGHGHVKTLDYVRVENEFLPILTSDLISTVDSEYPPIAVFLACYTGAFDASEDALAEQLVLCERGPIAAIAASRVSGPYGLAMLSDGLLSGVYQDRNTTLGEVVLAAKRKLLIEHTDADLEAADRPQLQLIGAIASALSPQDYDLEAERREHVWQMHLLGDPLLQLQHPQPIEFAAPARSQPGATIEIHGDSLASGELTVEFAYRRDYIRRELDEVTGELATAEGRTARQKRYLAANNSVLAVTRAPVPAGPFAHQVTIPDGLRRGRYCLRLFIQGEKALQVGYREIYVRPSE